MNANGELNHCGNVAAPHGHPATRPLTDEELREIKRQLAEGKNLTRRKGSPANLGILVHGSTDHARWKRWAKEHPEPANLIRVELKKRSIELFVSYNSNRKQPTHCKRGHRFDESNTSIADAIPGVRRSHRRCRKCAVLRGKESLLNGRIGQPVIRRVLDALYEGKTLTEISGWRGKTYIGGLVKVCRLKIFCAEHPALGKKIVSLAQANRDAARKKSRRVIAVRMIASKGGEHAFTLVVDATHNLAENIRDDIRSSMLIDLAEGKLKPSEVSSRVREYVKRHNQMFGQYTKGFGLVKSLD